METMSSLGSDELDSLTSLSQTLSEIDIQDDTLQEVCRITFFSISFRPLDPMLALSGVNCSSSFKPCAAWLNGTNEFHTFFSIFFSLIGILRSGICCASRFNRLYAPTSSCQSTTRLAVRIVRRRNGLKNACPDIINAINFLQLFDLTFYCEM